MAASNKPNKQDFSALQPLLTGTGLLDHFHLPKGLVHFLRRYQIQIWSIIICITVITISYFSYTSYIAHRNNKAAEAFENALAASNDQKEAMLTILREEYPKTPSALLATITLSKIKEDAGETEQAITYMEEAYSRIDADSSIRPMLLGKLAALYENNKNDDKALALYGELSTMEKFAAEANMAMGRISERTGKTADAITYYQNYLESSATTGAKQANKLQRDVVQFRLTQLQKQ